MSRIQNQIVVPPTINDSSLQDFSQIVQQNFEDLFEQSHNHFVRTTAPSSSEGAVNDIIPVVLNNVPYLYIKYPDPIGWKRLGPAT